MDASTPRSRPNHLAAATVLVWAVASLVALTLALAAMRIDRAETLDAGVANLAALRPFWWTCASGWLALSVMGFMMWRARACPFTRLLGRRSTSSWIILVVAIAIRAIVVTTHEPALSDDVFRYALDGRHLASGTNPYMLAPSESPWRALADPVNNPELHTIYLPLSQWAFAAIAMTMPEEIGAAAASRVFRGAMCGAELIAIVLLFAMLRRARRSIWWASLYTWHPLAVCEIAGSGHQEALGLPLLLGALLLWSRWPRRAWLWSAPLAAALLVKPVVLPMGLLVLRGRSWRTWLLTTASGALVCALLAGPLLAAHGGRPLTHLVDTASRFSLKWAHFGALYEPLLALIARMAPDWGNDPQERLARLLCGVALIAILLRILRRVRSVALGAQAMTLAMILCSPVVHPWYLLWGLMLLPLSPHPATWMASLTLAWGYTAFGYVIRPDRTVGWGVSPWLMAAAYAPILAAVLWPATGSSASTGGRPRYHEPLPLTEKGTA